MSSPVASILSGGHVQRRGHWKMVAATQAEEDAFDFQATRGTEHKLGLIGSTANFVKGALGAGLLAGHVAYMKGGLMPAVTLNLILGVYVCYCLYLLVKMGQILYKRTRVTSMTYPDIGEAAVQCHPNPKVSRFSKCFRFTIDFVLIVDLFGTCCVYQLIIAKSIKQLVENNQKGTFEGIPGYPNLRVYLAIMIIPIAIICLIRYLKWLAPFSLVANLGIVLCVGMSIYYAFEFNPKFENLSMVNGFEDIVQMIGINVYSMSAASIAVPTENNMREPNNFGYVIWVGYIFIITSVFCISFFGYVAFTSHCEAPITVNFPPSIGPIILKGFLPFMLYVTHAIVFWVAFDILFCYIKPRLNPETAVRSEYIYRFFISILVSLIAIIFPNVAGLMSFLGGFCISNMAFIWPNIIYLLVISPRPGFGVFKWKLWKGIFLIIIGITICSCGTYISLRELLFTKVH